MSTLLHDLRLAARALRRSPGFTLVAVLTLALGIGANAAVFSVFNAVLVRPLSYPEPERLVWVTEANPSRGWFGTGVVGPVYAAWREEQRSFPALGAYLAQNATLTGLAEPIELAIASVSDDLFDVLGVEPLLGRRFEPEDHAPDAPRVALLARGFWLERFGGDSSVIGRAVTLNDGSITVIGVMPDDGELTPSIEAWVPMPDVYREMSIGAHLLTVIGRLRPGGTADGAREELAGLMRRVLATAPEGERGWTAEVTPLSDMLAGSAGLTLRVLLGAVGLVMLIACTNVANFTLVRATGRRREIAVRSALGASRSRVARALLAESGLLAAVGAVIGLALAALGLRAIVALAPDQLPRLDTVALDGMAVAFTLAVTSLAALLFGVLPAFSASRVDLQTVLRDGDQGALGRTGRRDALAVAEIALALMLAAGAGLLVRSLVRLQRVDLGFEPAGVLALDLDLPARRYADPESRIRLVQSVEDRLRQIPGLRQVGSTRALPLESGGPDTEFDIEGRGAGDARGWAFFTPVTAGYHEAIGATLLAGRHLAPADDRAEAPLVVVVNEALARQHWPQGSAVGQRIRLADQRSAEIVGVLRNLRQRLLADEPRPAIYVPFAHLPQTSVSTVIRARGDPLALIPAIHQAVWAVDPALPVEQWTMAELMRNATARPRFNTVLLGLFAALAVALAVIGVYGVVSVGVAARRRELGLRIALGARRGDVVGLVLRRGGVLTALGVALGLAGAAGLTRLMAGMLYGIRPADPTTLGAAALGVAAVVLAACLAPARRAAAVDPVETLRRAG